MEILLFLAGLIYKSVIDIPGSTIQFIMILVTITIIKILGSNNENIDIKITYKTIMFMICLLTLQAIAMWKTSNIIGKDYFTNGVLKLGVFIVVLGFYFICLRLLLTDDRSIQLFVRGSFYAFIILAIVCIIQLTNVIDNTMFNNILSINGKYFERQNPIRTTWYMFGSYTQTLRRVNGFYAESGFLASTIAIVFSPFVLSAIQNKVNIFSPSKRYSPTLFYILILTMCLILLGAKTSTGIVAVVLGAFFLLWNNKKNRLYLIVGYVLIISIVIWSYDNIPFVQDTFTQYIFEKGTSSGSTLMRLGISESAIKTILQHPIVGVGFKQTGFFNLLNAPEYVKGLAEYKLLATYGLIGDQSVILAIIAQFGILISVVVGYSIFKLFKRMTHLSKLLENKNDNKNMYYKAILDSGKYFLLMFFSLSIISFSWDFTLILVLFMFYYVVSKYIEEHIGVNND